MNKINETDIDYVIESFINGNSTSEELKNDLIKLIGKENIIEKKDFQSQSSNFIDIAPIVSVKNLYKKYKRRKEPAIDDVSFNIYPGQFHAFIGANGAGKTTTIKSIIGAYSKYKRGGTILIGGYENETKEAKKLIGYIPEEAKFPRKISTRTYLKYMAILSGYSVQNVDEKVDEIINNLGLEQLANKKYGESDEITKAMRIIADHVRTATFMLGDQIGVTPSNVDQGYVLRRLIRRAIRFMRQLDIQKGEMVKIALHYVDFYREVYPELEENRQKIVDELTKEEEKFSKALEQGTKEFERVVAKAEGKTIDGQTAFRLYDTFGFPIEMTVEFAKEKGFEVDVEGFREKFSEHQKKSQLGSEQRFKGGLADHSEKTTRLHTATHLLQAALRKVLGDEVAQKGSNITEERLRFDFSFGRPMTKEEIAETQRLVNEAIKKAMPITCREMTVEEAKNEGAIGLFGDKYGEIVKVYAMGDFSKEICGGPHATNTSELGEFVITKEQSSSSGVRRIKAELR